MSHAMCHVSCIVYHMSPVTCHMRLTPTATATDPAPANSPTIYSRMDCKDPQIYFFRGAGQKLQFLRPCSFHYFYVQ